MPNLFKPSPAPEVPGTLARIGRGLTDVIDPVQQIYYDITRNPKAASLEQSRKEDEALYLRGVGGDPNPDRGPDTWRMVGRSAPLLAYPPYAAATPEAAMGSMGTMQAINAFDTLREWLAKRTQQASGAIEAMR